MVGIAEGDDAGVFALGDGRALIQTVDIFTPVVDDPYDWGRIAAANALSDIYAMGGTPLTALSYLAWPRGVLQFEVASDVLRGGFDVMAAAGCTVVGGHSIDGPEPTFGFAVTGLANGAEVIGTGGAQIGDVLLLTKPLGLGIITTAIKNGICPPDVMATAIEVMAVLNDVAGSALVVSGATASTDVTGFGLLGHLREMCEASGTGAWIDSSAVPVIPGARDLLDAGAWAGGSGRNLASLQDVVDTDVAETEVRILADAQTSGGLLVALSPASVDRFLDRVPGAVAVGGIVSGDRILVT